MTDRFRKAKRRRRRIRRAIFLMGAIAFWRFFGPGNALIGTSVLSPLLERGDVVFILPARSHPTRHDVILTAPPMAEGSVSRRVLDGVAALRRPEESDRRQPSYVPRLVVAQEGDQVTWTDRTVTVRSGETVETYRLPPVHEDLAFPFRQSRLGRGELFLIALQAGRLDSRFTGPVELQGRSYRIRRVIWPMDRRTQITSDEIRKHF
jgi:hypothetical protein